MATTGMSSRTSKKPSIAGSAVSFDVMVDDLRALYSGRGVTLRVDDVISDIKALYTSADLPISLSDLNADLRELYGDESVAWSEFVADFESLYEVHHFVAA